MKKYFACLVILLILCVPANAKEWYQGGTLHSANIGEWKQASYDNKLATCADFIANLWMHNKLKINVAHMDTLKIYAKELVTCIDKATDGIDDVNDQSVSSIAAMGMTMMEWIK